MVKLMEKYQAKADAAAQACQETGLTRYHSAYWRNQDMADALRMALSAKEDHDTLRDMRLVLSNFASRGAAAESPYRSPDGASGVGCATGGGSSGLWPTARPDLRRF